jgi:hypothetical protein
MLSLTGHVVTITKRDQCFTTRTGTSGIIPLCDKTTSATRPHFRNTNPPGALCKGVGRINPSTLDRPYAYILPSTQTTHHGRRSCLHKTISISVRQPTVSHILFFCVMFDMNGQRTCGWASSPLYRMFVTIWGCTLFCYLQFSLRSEYCKMIYSVLHLHV